MTVTKTEHTGVCVISIDVALPAERTSAVATGALDQACEGLLSQLEELRLSATWAVDEPARWPLAKLLNDGAVEQELAVLASAEWIGSAAGRQVFAQELGRRVLAGRAAGWALTTLVPHDSAIDDHLDLLVKHDVTAVRGIVDLDARASRPAQPHPLHYGLWELPGSLALPGRQRWLPGGGGGWKARRRIDRAAKSGEVFHLVLDVAAVIAGGPAAERTVQKVLRHAALRQEQGRLSVLTMAELTQRLTPVRESVSSRSILRAAG